MDGKNGMTGSRVEWRGKREAAKLEMGGEIPDLAAVERDLARKEERKKSNSNGKMAETPKSPRCVWPWPFPPQLSLPRQGRPPSLPSIDSNLLQTIH